MTFKSYDNFEDAFEDMRKAEEAANRRVLPPQRLIGWGDYWFRVIPDWDLVIFGYVYTEAENEKGERDAGASDEEWEYTHNVELDSYKRGYRFGKAYSTIEPTGELGSTHISEMVPISQEQFEEARGLKWSLVEIKELPWFRWALDNMVAWEAHNESAQLFPHQM